MSTMENTLLLKGLPTNVSKMSAMAFVKQATSNLTYLNVYPWPYGAKDYQALAVIRFEDLESAKHAFKMIGSLIEVSKVKDSLLDPTHLRVQFKKPHASPNVFHNAKPPLEEFHKDNIPKKQFHEAQVYKPQMGIVFRRVCPACKQEDCLYHIIFRQH